MNDKVKSAKLSDISAVKAAVRKYIKEDMGVVTGLKDVFDKCDPTKDITVRNALTVAIAACEKVEQKIATVDIPPAQVSALVDLKSVMVDILSLAENLKLLTKKLITFSKTKEEAWEAIQMMYDLVDDCAAISLSFPEDCLDKRNSSAMQRWVAQGVAQGVKEHAAWDALMKKYNDDEAACLLAELDAMFQSKMGEVINRFDHHMRKIIKDTVKAAVDPNTAATPEQPADDNPLAGLNKEDPWGEAARKADEQKT